MHTAISVLTVSQLNKQVKQFLEIEIGIIHVEGEISNLTKASSGHVYFTLKDSAAQIRCVYFKNRHINGMNQKVTDGIRIVVSGRLSLYEARGDYQLIVEQVTEAGLGELYQQFEALKTKLANEGLFNPERKKPIPVIPQAIGIITSATGAAIRDILSTLERRFPLAQVVVYPSEVQGSTASQQLIQALQRAEKDQRCDVIILARGGGSIEDLWAFNDEQLARQIASCTIPIISGVGHETDFTIADFVADYRAETPTAAATAATPDWIELMSQINTVVSRLHIAMTRKTQTWQLKLNHLKDKVCSPENTIATYWQTLDYLEKQLLSSVKQLILRKRHQLSLNSSQLHAQNPKTHLDQTKTQIERLSTQLVQSLKIRLNQAHHQLTNLLSTLHVVSPLATLDRGYAIATHQHTVMFTTDEVKVGEIIEVRLSKGRLDCEVTQIKE
jgi:exodeoxyribonuclease VII large subunit